MIRDTFDRFQEPQRGLFGDNEAAPAKSQIVNGSSDIIDLTLELRQEKPLSIAVTDPSVRGGKWIWLPKSQIEFERKSGAIIEVQIPEWLAKDKGLI